MTMFLGICEVSWFLSWLNGTQPSSCHSNRHINHQYKIPLKKVGNRNKEDVTVSSSRSSQTIEIPTYSKEWIMVCCHGPTKIKYASYKYGRSVAKQLCNMEDTLGSLAHLEKPLNATSKTENILGMLLLYWPLYLSELQMASGTM